MRLLRMIIICLCMPIIGLSNTDAHLPQLLSWPSVERSQAHNKTTSIIATPITCVLMHNPYIDKAMITDLLQQKKAGWLSPRGSIQLFAAKHRLSLCDDDVHRYRLESYLKKLDQPPTQIQIRARIVSVDQHYLRDLGVNFSTESSEKIASKNNNAPSSSGDLVQSGMHIILTSFNAEQLLGMQLHALVSHGHAQVIASPTLLTSDGHSANIESGEEVPYQQGTLSGGTSVAFKKAVMQLTVMPQIIHHNRVILSIKVHQDKVTPVSVNGVPIISTEQMSTSAIVHNKNTLIIGGIVEKQRSDAVEGVPILQHVPILGLLFKRHHKQIQTKELLIFIHPQW